MDELAKMLGLKVLQPAAQSAILDPATRRALEFQVAQLMRSEEVKRAFRPLLLEASIWIGGSVLLAVLVANQFRG